MPKMALGQKPTLHAFLICEHQIHREDCEIYLRSLKTHVHTQLLKIQDAQRKMAEAVGEKPAAIQVKNSRQEQLVSHASKYWEKHRSAKYDEVYDNYCRHCPAHLRLSRVRWEELVREYLLDPRSDKEKTRGQGQIAL